MPGAPGARLFSACCAHALPHAHAKTKRTHHDDAFITRLDFIVLSSRLVVRQKLAFPVFLCAFAPLREFIPYQAEVSRKDAKAQRRI
jgi:hypothetical protein